MSPTARHVSTAAGGPPLLPNPSKGFPPYKRVTYLAWSHLRLQAVANIWDRPFLFPDFLPTKPSTIMVRSLGLETQMAPRARMSLRYKYSPPAPLQSKGHLDHSPRPPGIHPHRASALTTSPRRSSNSSYLALLLVSLPGPVIKDPKGPRARWRRSPGALHTPYTPRLLPGLGHQSDRRTHLCNGGKHPPAHDIRLLYPPLPRLFPSQATNT